MGYASGQLAAKQNCPGLTQLHESLHKQVTEAIEQARQIICKLHVGVAAPCAARPPAALILFDVAAAPSTTNTTTDHSSSAGGQHNKLSQLKRLDMA